MSQGWLLIAGATVLSYFVHLNFIKKLRLERVKPQFTYSNIAPTEVVLLIFDGVSYGGLIPLNLPSFRAFKKI